MEEVPAKADKNPTSAKGLIRRGFLGSKTASPSILVVKEVLLSIQDSKVDNVESQVYSTISTSSLSLGVAELGVSISRSIPRMSEGGAPIYSVVSKSQMGYSQRVKEKVAK